MPDRIFREKKIPDSIGDVMMSAMEGSTHAEQQFHLVEHSVHIVFMVVLLILCILGVVFLVRFFLMPALPGSVRNIPSNRSFLGRRKRTGFKAAGNGKAREQVDQDTFLVIPDISGYTRFIQLNRFSVAHAQYVVSALLDAIIEAATPVLRPTRIEGDSIVFFAVSAGGDPPRGVSGEQVGLATLDLLNAFYSKRAEFKHNNACRCEACRHIEDLQLKVVVHVGSLLYYHVKEFEDLVGLPIIAARRLLKNSLGLGQYVIVTEAAGEAVHLPLKIVSERSVEHYDDVGEIAFRVYDFGLTASELEARAERGSSIARRMRDAGRKLVQNARTLGSTAGAGASS